MCEDLYNDLSISYMNNNLTKGFLIKYKKKHGPIEIIYVEEESKEAAINRIEDKTTKVLAVTNIKKLEDGKNILY